MAKSARLKFQRNQQNILSYVNTLLESFLELYSDASVVIAHDAHNIRLS
jgi:hypothetical protein